ncbi:MAG: two-component sensor histidine kinase [Desulfobacteraceae bacterium]|nr:two-component sensor histidine kinase [Desulfobacteraceae bacterium]
MNKNKIWGRPYYKSLTRNIMLTVIVVSFTPMILVSLVILYQFKTSYHEKVNAHLEELVLKHKQNIDIFLQDKTSDIKILSRSYGMDQLSNDSFLAERLSILQQEYKDVFVDMGVLNEQGLQVAYAGPFKLKNANYHEAAWFKKAIKNEVSVSDLFLGLRGLPHFIISARQKKGDQYWILRATIDFLSFNDLVENIRIGETGFAFIINRKNEFQTKPRVDISSEKELYKSLLVKKPEKFNGVQITIEQVGRKTKSVYGDEYLYVSSFLKNNDWLLVYRQNTSDAFSTIRRSMSLALVILIFGGSGIIAMTYLLSRRMVGFIAKSDTEKQLMNQRMVETSKLASIGELASGVAHEINNPVAIMVEEAGWIQDLLEEEEFSNSENLDEFERALNQIKAQGHRCKKITRKLLSFARKTQSNNHEININDLIREIIEHFKKRIKGSNVTMETDIKDPLPIIHGSNTELQQIFLNLINNGVDALGKTDGIVKISAMDVDGQILIKISDTGAGISPVNLDRIFDPFFTTKPVGKGTGLGLFICYGIIKKMGGKIDVDSVMDIGTTFSIYLPVNDKKNEKNL